MTNVVYRQEACGYTVKVWQDDGDDSLNPRNDDNLGLMVCFHRRYNLGDKHNMTVEAVQDILAGKGDYIALPLYLYDHTGISMSCTPFSCKWDSGQVGAILVSLEAVRKEYGVKRVSGALRQKVLTILKSEVETYDDYLTGNIHGYLIEDSQGEVIESCGGYFGDVTENSHVVKDALSMAACLQKQRLPLFAAAGLV